MAMKEERLMEWLSDAHAMEQQAAQLFGKQAERIQHYPDIKTRYEQHAAAAGEQAERLRVCIERRGGSPSALKGTTAQVLGMMQSASGLFVGDEIVKSVLVAYTFNHMEIAAYRILIAAAGVAEDAETRRICEQNLAQEEEMAAWLEHQLQTTTTQYLLREQAGREAKH